MTTERAKVSHLMRRGAHLAVDADKTADFEALGHQVSYEAREALERATVVIDCTPAGNENKKIYETIDGPNGFIAQGSEFGFGKPYAIGINEEALIPGEDRFIQIVSCNTHNIATLIKTLGSRDGELALSRAAVRVHAARERHLAGLELRSSQRGQHDDPDFGTHPRATRTTLRDHGVETPDLLLRDEAEPAYMHSLWFDISSRAATREKVLQAPVQHRIAMTEKRSANQIFSFGRDHGYYGPHLLADGRREADVTVTRSGR